MVGVVALGMSVALSACSFARATQVNAPPRCSSETERVDYLAAAGLAVAGAATFVLVPCDEGNCRQQDVLGFAVIPAVVASIGFLASAIYGGNVRDRCELTTTSSSRSGRDPAASAP